MSKRIAAFILSLAVLFTLTACNTTRGVGQDVEAAGDAVQRAAQ